MIDAILKLPQGFDDATTWVLLSLVCFLALLVFLKIPAKVAEALDARRDRIKKELDDAVQLLEEARELLASYQRRAREAEAEAEGIIAAAKREADRLTEKARTELTQNLARRQVQAERKIAQAEADATAMVRRHAAELAAIATQALLVEKLDKQKDASLVSASIKEFEERF
jgi:F-type H+-transporting ATPase subunit b